jgi:uncharacterized membrane protein
MVSSSGMGKRDWRYLSFLVLAHHRSDRINRTIHISFLSRHLYFCARCTGRYAALVGMLAAFLIGYTLTPWLCLLLVALLPLPGIADWISQSCRLRESKNSIRIVSGAFLGIAEGSLLLLLLNGSYVPFLIGAGVIGCYAFGIYLLAAKTSRLKSYLEEITHGA